jgi:hypothetical protein
MLQKYKPTSMQVGLGVPQAEDLLVVIVHLSKGTLLHGKV